ncbi:hypothetical protein CKO09_03990 [Chromatium weissei]|nr:hypothetical protein [Chromatium weissei]
MPYFVYQIMPPRQLMHLQTCDNYQEARTLVRQRRQLEIDAKVEYRLIFAHQPGEAEKLLSAPRDERVIGED